jgi:BlaI family transcriptional regulator, penicillinase repressor
MKVVLTVREAEFMEILWDYGPSTVADVRERLPDEPAYTTVLTILRNLEAKGYVAASKEGRAHRYAACVEREAARRNALRDLSAKFFKGSAEQLLLHLVSKERLSDEQIMRIQKLLSAKRKKSSEERS